MVLTQPVCVEQYPRSQLKLDLVRIVVEHRSGWCSDITIEDRRGNVLARRQQRGHLSYQQACLDFALSWPKYLIELPWKAWESGLLASEP